MSQQKIGTVEEVYETLSKGCNLLPYDAPSTQAEKLLRRYPSLSKAIGENKDTYELYLDEKDIPTYVEDKLLYG